MYTIRENEKFNSREVIFDAKPDRETIDGLKANKMRWHSKGGFWYGYASREDLEKLLGGNAPAAPAVKAAPVNKYGVKVGDLFSCSWGYDQTNVDFFQVVALAGTSSVKVRAVCPEVDAVDWEAPLAIDRSYKVPESGELLPARRSIFIKDTEGGDLKRLSECYDGGACFYIGNHYWCRPYHGETCYESFYA